MSNAQQNWKIDGWKNILTGIGSKMRDKKMSSTLFYSGKSQFSLEEFYASSKIAEKIVDYPVDEAFRKGVLWKFPEVEDQKDLAKEWRDYIKKFNLEAKWIQAAKWARLYGAGFLVFGIDDGKRAEDPVDFNNIKKVNWVQVMHRWDLHVATYGTDVGTDYFRNPEVYRLNVAGASIENEQAGLIHASRVIRIDGAHLPDLLYRGNNYFHDSVLTKVMDTIRDYEMGFENVGAILNDFAQGIFKLKNLSAMLAQGKDDLVRKRLELIDTQRSVIRGIVLDMEEDFSREGTPLTGIPEVMDRMGSRLVAVSEMPHTVLLGEGASGSLSGQGDSEDTNWSNFISTQQNTRMIPTGNAAAKILMMAKDSPTKGIVPQGFETDFPPMHEMSEAEMAELHDKQATADEKYLRNGVLTPEEVALSRFGDTYSLDTNIDVELRQEPEMPKEEDDPSQNEED